MPGATARLAKNAPSTLTAWMARQSSSLTSSTGRLTWPRTPPATCTSTSTAPQARSTSRTKPSTSADCVRSTLRVSSVPPRWGLARAFSAASSPSRRSQAHTLAPRSTKPSTMPPPIPRAAPVTMTAWLSKWMSISRSFRRLRAACSCGNSADRQLEGAPHLAAVAAALMRRHSLPGRRKSASSCSGANGRAGWPAPRSGRHSWRWSIRARRPRAGR